ncbi:MAG: protein-glutamate O-methyltransferase CheR [Curvibacter lanceolatus]|jgi:chemotaxis protein methyltransferase CheR|uniref:CheR family methyltransferase n=1 Tax=Curvibacter lanceolatus TaxID=86182 RepID=UPI0003784BFD|nr:protein-glutamate O-methyltransferase CheR [Curvibacter lanceolatus]MBV5291396.1 protein-glutamate O-methyltransferase CheR [Curvibacter lanceolatus]
MSRALQPGAAPAGWVLGDTEFGLFQHWIHRVAGITMGPAKKALVAGRLARRVSQHGLGSFEAYFELLQRDPQEHQLAVDLLTTNETHFFREPRHFELMRGTVLPQHPAGRPLRVWSAACSTGQEPYSLAMLMAHVLGAAPWEVLGTDLSTRVLERARQGLYDTALAREIPEPFLRAFCFKGVGAQHGRFLIAPELRRRVRFEQVNLNEALPDLGEFDVIFLRNVMIYFNDVTKRGVIERLLRALRPRGWLVVGHSESLNGISPLLQAHSPSVYRKHA